MAEDKGENQESCKLKWMYEGANSSIDREAYLLGKRIKDPTGDKGDFIVKDEKDKNYDVEVLERLDYESKMRLDPLISMKKTEADKRWELLQNPIKRKKLQAAWEHALKRDLKKSKKKKKKRTSSNDSSSSTSRKRSKKTSKSRDIVKAAESDDKIRNSLKMALESQLGDLSSDDSSDSSSDEDRRRKSKKASKRKQADHFASKNDKRSEKVERKEGYGLLVLKNKVEQESSSYKKVDLSKANKNSKVALVRSKPTGFTKKLSAAELEKKRKEMMKNAEDRNKSRKSKIKKYALEDKADQIREEILKQSQLKKTGKYSKAKTFIHDMSLHHSSTGSLEDSLNRKRFTITKKTDQTM